MTGVSTTGVLRSEWTKLRSVPSTLWSLATSVVLIVGFGAVYSMVRVTRPPRGAEALAAFDATGVSLTGVHLAQLAVGVLGVLLVTGEYATGAIRVTLAAVPARLPVLWAKAAVFTLVSLAVCLPATIIAFAVGQSVLAAEHLDVAASAPGVARAVFGGALYLAAVGVLGLGLGALLRSTAAAISALFGLLFMLTILAGMLPETWSDTIVKYLPGPAGLAMISARPDPAALGPWQGFAVFALYAAVVLGLAAWRLRRQDA